MRYKIFVLTFWTEKCVGTKASMNMNDEMLFSLELWVAVLILLFPSSSSTAYLLYGQMSSDSKAAVTWYLDKLKI